MQGDRIDAAGGEGKVLQIIEMDIDREPVSPPELQTRSGSQTINQVIEP
jgi:hypothetical protein